MLDGEPALTAKAGVAYSFVPSASDADQDPLTFSITGMPAWATFDTATGALSGTPGDANVGQTGDIEIGVSDGKAESTIGPFRIEVAARDAAPPPANTTPVITGTPATLVVATQSYIFVPTATDSDNDTLSFSIANRPSWATFSTATGQLSGTPARTNAGTFANIRITVSDGKASTALPAFSIQVQAAPNSGPVIGGSPSTSVQVGTAYLFKPTASDIDGDTLTWSIQNKPAWAAFSTTTGQLSGTPTSTSVGTFANIRISVSDGKTSVALGTFSIVVSAAPNTAPTITGTPTTSVQSGTAYSFTPAAADADKDTLSFSITNKPSWATFSIANGMLSGTPTAAQVGTYAGIVISVSDGKATTSLQAFTLSVTATPNKVPTISGVPATSVTAGSAYNFTPSSSDPDGDALTFSIASKPSWATFSTTTGKLSGTPAAGDAGTTSGIVISVSDGKATASLAAFQIVVNAAPAATGSATLSWTPPTTNADGSLLTDLAGFRIYYGNSSGAMNQSMTISDPLTTTGTVSSLGSGTWYFNVKAYTSAGIESSASPTVSKTIN
ncbi:MAG: putative Ig domain-containing protein [Gammaproteobacteria bacterium]